MSFDKLAALYVFCMDYHTGQNSRLYRILSKISTQYRIQLTDNDIAAIQSDTDRYEWYAANTIYHQLTAKWSNR